MALAAQTVLTSRFAGRWRRLLLLWPLLLAGCIGTPERAPLPTPAPPPLPPAPSAPLPPTQPLPRPLPPPGKVVRPGAPPSAAPSVDSSVSSPQPAATGSLVALADTQAAAGDYPAAAAQLERALRIRPQDPVLWQKLAWLRLQNGEFDQAASLAARSNSLAGNNVALRAQNQRIVDLAHARKRSE